MIIITTTSLNASCLFPTPGLNNSKLYFHDHLQTPLSLLAKFFLKALLKMNILILTVELYMFVMIKADKRPL